MKDSLRTSTQTVVNVGSARCCTTTLPNEEHERGSDHRDSRFERCVVFVLLIGKFDIGLELLGGRRSSLGLRGAESYQPFVHSWLLFENVRVQRFEHRIGERCAVRELDQDLGHDQECAPVVWRESYSTNQSHVSRVSISITSFPLVALVGSLRDCRRTRLDEIKVIRRYDCRT